MNRLPLGTLGRATLLSAVVLGTAAFSTGCLDRPVAPATPRTSNAITAQVSINSVDKIDLLFSIDNSSSMADKQAVLALAVPDLVNRLVNPVCVDPAGKPVSQPMTTTENCPMGSAREFTALKDIHIGVVSSSLGSGGADSCTYDPSAPSSGNNPTRNDNGHLVHRKGQSPTTDFTYAQQDPTYQVCPNGVVPCDPNTPGSPKATQDTGFLAWDPGNGKGGGYRNDPPGSGDVAMLSATFTDMILGVDQTGCGYEAQMEAWYRFLVDPTPLATVTLPNGVGQAAAVTVSDAVVLQERAEFLRPDSLVAIVLVSDEDEHSFIIGQMPPGVCDKPDMNGGCQEALKPWPDSYQAQLNYGANSQACNADSDCPNGVPCVPASTVPGNTGPKVCANPFPYNYLQNQVSVGGALFNERSGTSACADDPYSPECQECMTQNPTTMPAANGCKILSSDEDGLDLRQWNTKARFGWDPQTPMQKYVDALTQQQVYSFYDGTRQQNPLFDDLPFNLAKQNNSPLKRGKFPARNPNLVFLATIVGVPWQDIARVNDQMKPDLSLGYQTAADLSKNHPIAGVEGWDLILGDPFNPDKTKRKQPIDPLMIDNRTDQMSAPRLMEGTPHPVTKEPLGYNTPWNSINGHEWNSGSNDLGYACIFPLPPNSSSSKTGQKVCVESSQCDCNLPTTMTGPSIDALKAEKNPLCEPPKDPQNPDAGGAGQDAIVAVDMAGNPVQPVMGQLPAGSFGAQYRAKAYPGKRYLEIQKRLANAGGNAIVASICAKNLTDPTAADYGYRPAVAAIIEQLKDKLRGQCLPRQIPVDPTDGSSPCVILAAKYAKDDQSATSDEIGACQKCADQARTPVPGDIKSNLTGDVLNYRCLCAIPQFTGTKPGGDLYTCKSDAGATSLPSGKGGWCYVDPKAANQPPGADQIVKGCPANEKQTIRFLDANTNDTTLFITCLGAAAGAEPFTPSTGAGGAGGATGAAGAAGGP